MENMKNVFDWWILPCQGTPLFQYTDSGCECDDTKAAILYPVHEDFSGIQLFMSCVK